MARYQEAQRALKAAQRQQPKQEEPKKKKKREEAEPSRELSERELEREERRAQKLAEKQRIRAERYVPGVARYTFPYVGELRVTQRRRDVSGGVYLFIEGEPHVPIELQQYAARSFAGDPDEWPSHVHEDVQDYEGGDKLHAYVAAQDYDPSRLRPFHPSQCPLTAPDKISEDHLKVLQWDGEVLLLKAEVPATAVNADLMHDLVEVAHIYMRFRFVPVKRTELTPAEADLLAISKSHGERPPSASAMMSRPTSAGAASIRRMRPGEEIERARTLDCIHTSRRYDDPDVYHVPTVGLLQIYAPHTQFATFFLYLEATPRQPCELILHRSAQPSLYPANDAMWLRELRSGNAQYVPERLTNSELVMCAPERIRFVYWDAPLLRLHIDFESDNTWMRNPDHPSRHQRMELTFKPIPIPSSLPTAGDASDDDDFTFTPLSQR
jgi:hypothetical protein